MRLKEESLISITAIIIGALIALYLAYPFLNSSFIAAAIDQPEQAINRLNDFSYTYTFYLSNMSLVIHLFNPNNFTVYIESVKGPGFSSTSAVSIPPMTNGTVVTKVYDLLELMRAYTSHDVTVTVVLKFLNVTVRTVVRS